MHNVSFYHHGLEYKLLWVDERFRDPVIFDKFGNRLLQYIRFTQSNDFPETLFRKRDGLRCSSFRIKHLIPHGKKKISLSLIKNQYVQQISINPEKQQNSMKSYPSNQTPSNQNSIQKQQTNEAIEILPKMARIWYDIFTQLDDSNPGHEPILQKIIELHPNALAVEVPVWTTTLSSIQNRVIKPSPFNCFADSEFTGHIDLVLYDPTDSSLIIADYKPEGQFLSSLPQVATYGLVMKQVIGYSQIKCVSFSREHAWIYDPEIIRTVVIKYLKNYGDPPLEWKDIIFSI